MMPLFSEAVQITPNILVGKNKPLLIAGPCVIESELLCMQIAERMQKVAEVTGFNYVFKASFDKANRTAIKGFRGNGIYEGLQILAKVKASFNLPILTDIHLPEHAKLVAGVIDVLQIPAFLCRQTDLLIAAGESGIATNIKKGQFMSPEDMRFAVEKVKSTGNKNILLTERGASFGYHNLVVDMRSLPIMRQYAPIIFDVTHSVQMPGGSGDGKSGGNREFAPYLAKAAAAVGVDGFFIETHPTPDQALSDGPNMIPLHEMQELLKKLYEIHVIGNKS